MLKQRPVRRGFGLDPRNRTTEDNSSKNTLAAPVRVGTEKDQNRTVWAPGGEATLWGLLEDSKKNSLKIGKRARCPAVAKDLKRASLVNT